MDASTRSVQFKPPLERELTPQLQAGLGPAGPFGEKSFALGGYISQHGPCACRYFSLVTFSQASTVMGEAHYPVLQLSDYLLGLFPEAEVNGSTRGNAYPVYPGRCDPGSPTACLLCPVIWSEVSRPSIG